MKELKFKIIHYNDIPEDLTAWHYINDYSEIEFVPLPILENHNDKLTQWIIDNYPEVKQDKFILIENNNY
jgi:hypothetical protein